MKEPLRCELGHLRTLLCGRCSPLERPRARLGALSALDGRGRGRLEGIWLCGPPRRPPHWTGRRRPRALLRGLEPLAQTRDLAFGLDEAAAVVDDLVDACVEIKFQAPHAIDATSLQ